MATAAVAEPKVSKQSKAKTRPRTAQWYVKHGREQVLTRVFLILICGYYILPFYFMLISAVKTDSELTQNPPTWYPHTIALSNFSKAIDVIPFWSYFYNTVFITALSVVGVVLTVPLVAYGFSRIEWPGRDKVFYLVLATVFIPY